MPINDPFSPEGARALAEAMRRVQCEAEERPLSSRLRPDVECAPWVIEEVKKLERRLATPQPPKDAGAVPLPKMVGMISDRPICFQDEVARYGNAREAAGREDAVPEGYVLAPHFRGFAHLGLGRYLLFHSHADAEAELSIVPATPGAAAGRTVGDLRDDGPKEIPAELMAVRLRFENVSGLDALEQQLRLLRETHYPQHPPAEPAARAQVGDGACGYVNKDGTVTWYAENFGTVSCKPKPGAQIFTHPSPAHAADAASLRALIADDGWAISFQSLAQYRTALLERCGSMLSRREAIERAGDDTTKLARLIGVTYPSGCIAFTPEQLTEFARRLAGGDHA